MSQFQDDLNALSEKRCRDCHGRGWCDDAHECDIMFNTWPCTTCNGSGYGPQPKPA